MKRIITTGALFALLAAPALGERGADGRLKLIYWQSAASMNPYLATGTADLEAPSLVIESLARFDDEGRITPFLAAEIPTVENGGVAADLRSITWKLKPGLLWSDGTPFTAHDAVFTWRYCTHPDFGCVQERNFESVAAVEALDDLTLRITFDTPKPFPYTALVGSQSPVLQAAQFADCLGAKAITCTEANFNPVGTGPYRVAAFRPHDVIEFEINPHYREADKPAFAAVTFKSGGDAESAARSVLQTGEFDYAWNLQISPALLAEMEAGGEGVVASAFGTAVERIHVNFTNPDPALGPDRRSVWTPDGANAHPILSDIRVRRALARAIDTTALNELGYGATGRLTCNVIPGPEAYVSTANDACLIQDMEEARRLLDEAGWVPGADGVRMKDGKPLRLHLVTTTNGVRQEFQAVLKEWWSRIGVDTVLSNVPSGVFFGADPASPDTNMKLYADLAMYTSNFAGVDPEGYLAEWRCDKIPGPDNQWLGDNINRWCDPDYDALSEKLFVTAGEEPRAAVVREMNDELVLNHVVIPLIYRSITSAHAKSLEGVKLNAWDTGLWNIADWRRAH